MVFKKIINYFIIMLNNDDELLVDNINNVNKKICLVNSTTADYWRDINLYFFLNENSNGDSYYFKSTIDVLNYDGNKNLNLQLKWPLNVEFRNVWSSANLYLNCMKFLLWYFEQIYNKNYDPTLLNQSVLDEEYYYQILFMNNSIDYLQFLHTSWSYFVKKIHDNDFKFMVKNIESKEYMNLDYMLNVEQLQKTKKHYNYLSAEKNLSFDETLINLLNDKTISDMYYKCNNLVLFWLELLCNSKFYFNNDCDCNIYLHHALLTRLLFLDNAKSLFNKSNNCGEQILSKLEKFILTYVKKYKVQLKLNDETFLTIQQQQPNDWNDVNYFFYNNNIDKKKSSQQYNYNTMLMFEKFKNYEFYDNLVNSKQRNLVSEEFLNILQSKEYSTHLSKFEKKNKQKPKNYLEITSNKILNTPLVYNVNFYDISKNMQPILQSTLNGLDELQIHINNYYDDKIYYYTCESCNCLIPKKTWYTNWCDQNLILEKSHNIEHHECLLNSLTCINGHIHCANCVLNYWYETAYGSTKYYKFACPNKNCKNLFSSQMTNYLINCLIEDAISKNLERVDLEKYYWMSNVWNPFYELYQSYLSLTFNYPERYTIVEFDKYTYLQWNYDKYNDNIFQTTETVDKFFNYKNNNDIQIQQKYNYQLRPIKLFYLYDNDIYTQHLTIYQTYYKLMSIVKKQQNLGFYNRILHPINDSTQLKIELSEEEENDQTSFYNLSAFWKMYDKNSVEFELHYYNSKNNQRNCIILYLQSPNSIFEEFNNIDNKIKDCSYYTSNIYFYEDYDKLFETTPRQQEYNQQLKIDDYKNHIFKLFINNKYKTIDMLFKNNKIIYNNGNNQDIAEKYLKKIYLIFKFARNLPAPCCGHSSRKYLENLYSTTIANSLISTVIVCENCNNLWCFACRKMIILNYHKALKEFINSKSICSTFGTQFTNQKYFVEKHLNIKWDINKFPQVFERFANYITTYNKNKIIVVEDDGSVKKNKKNVTKKYYEKFDIDDYHCITSSTKNYILQLAELSIIKLFE